MVAAADQRACSANDLPDKSSWFMFAGYYSALSVLMNINPAGAREAFGSRRQHGTAGCAVLLRCSCGTTLIWRSQPRRIQISTNSEAAYAPLGLFLALHYAGSLLLYASSVSMLILVSQR